MKSGKVFLSILIMASYLIFPGSGLALINQFFHDRGLPGIECSCDSQTGHQAGTPLDDHGEQSGMSDPDCPCWTHLPRNASAMENIALTGCLSIFEKAHAVPEVYYPIIVPPQNLAV